ncbi:hypothetical protein H5410_031503 [Solanum commersonii]|uniref:DUF4283 domain-containing protein n=1 Tax=Solanum commersonii TaxID=4109 RepID=A0A9J5YJD1_SOLCO|nr:hypothetical protein H5410_031503 [Solanum commersonii]
MAASQPLMEAGHRTYASLFRSTAGEVKWLPLKPISYQHGEPRVIWDQSEIEQMIINEDLQYAVVGKFSTLKWDPIFDSEEETSKAISWISFPSLPPNFFGKEIVFSLAAAIGKPLHVDMATKN